MLIKLIKHDLKSTYRDLVPIYIGLVVSAFLVVLSSNAGSLQILPFTTMIMFALLVATAVILTLTTIKLFTHRLYSSEGYLSFTLPVSTLEIFSSKIITAMIWSFVTSMVILFSLSISVGLLVFTHWDMVQSIPEQYGSLWSQLDVPMILSWLGQLLTISLPQMLINSLYFYAMVLFAVVIANTSYVSNHKMVVGILAYVILNFIFTNLNTNLLSTWLINIENLALEVNWLMYGLNFIYYASLSAGLIYASIWLNDHKLELQ